MQHLVKVHVFPLLLDSRELFCPSGSGPLKIDALKENIYLVEGKPSRQGSQFPPSPRL